MQHPDCFPGTWSSYNTYKSSSTLKRNAYRPPPPAHAPPSSFCFQLVTLFPVFQVKQIFKGNPIRVPYKISAHVTQQNNITQYRSRAVIRRTLLPSSYRYSLGQPNRHSLVATLVRMYKMKNLTNSGATDFASGTPRFHLLQIDASVC